LYFGKLCQFDNFNDNNKTLPLSVLKQLYYFVSGFTMQKLHNRTLHLHVFDYDRFSRDDSIGETYIELNNVSTSIPTSEKMTKAVMCSKTVIIYYNYVDEI